MKKIEPNIVPLIISVLLVLISIGIVITSKYVFNSQHYIGIGCLVVSTFLYFTNRKIYHLFFALTLTVGLIGFLDFFYTSVIIGFAGIGINPIFLGLMILFFAVSKKEMDKLSPEKNEVKTRSLNENLIKSFVSKFKNKTIEELNSIVDGNSKFTDEAKEASLRILKEKNLTQ